MAVIKKKTLDQFKTDKILEINNYDASKAVRSFVLNKTDSWFNFITRKKIRYRIEKEKHGSSDKGKLYINGKEERIPFSKLEKMMKELEIYATARHDITNEHIYNVNSFDKIEDVNSYDFKSLYPEKLSFNL